MRRAAMPALLVLAVAVAGCAGERSIADCGMQVHAPARPIDEGVRFDVREVTGGSIDPRGVSYRFYNASALDAPAVFEGDLWALMEGGGDRTLRYLDARNDSLLNVGDAWVVRGYDHLLLQLGQGGSLIGSSVMC